jgi:hypothetical protein
VKWGACHSRPSPQTIHIVIPGRREAARPESIIPGGG